MLLRMRVASASARHTQRAAGAGCVSNMGRNCSRSTELGSTECFASNCQRQSVHICRPHPLSEHEPVHRLNAPVVRPTLLPARHRNDRTLQACEQDNPLHFAGCTWARCSRQHRECASDCAAARVIAHCLNAGQGRGCASPCNWHLHGLPLAQAQALLGHVHSQVGIIHPPDRACVASVSVHLWRGGSGSNNSGAPRQRASGSAHAAAALQPGRRCSLSGPC